MPDLGVFGGGRADFTQPGGMAAVEDRAVGHGGHEIGKRRDHNDEHKDDRSRTVKQVRPDGVEHAGQAPTALAPQPDDEHGEEASKDDEMEPSEGIPKVEHRFPAVRHKEDEPGQYEAGEEEHLTGLFRADVAEGTGQPVHGERQADGDDGGPKHDHPSAHLGAEQGQQGQRHEEEGPGSGAEHKHEPKQSENGDGLPRVEIDHDFGQRQILDLDDGLGHGWEDQRIGRARRHGVPRAFEIALYVVEHRVQHAQVDEQGYGQQPERRQHGGAVELRHELAFTPHDGDEQGQGEDGPGGAPKCGQGIGQPREQGRTAFARTGQQERHAAE